MKSPAKRTRQPSRHKSTPRMNRGMAKYLFEVLDMLTDSFLIGESAEAFSMMTKGLSEDMMRVFMFAFGYLSCEHAHYWVDELGEDGDQRDIDAFVEWFSQKAVPKILGAILEYEERKKRM